MEELSGKRKCASYIQGEGRLAIWKNYFHKLFLSSDNPAEIDIKIEQMFERHTEISTAEF